MEQSYALTNVQFFMANTGHSFPKIFPDPHPPYVHGRGAFSISQPPVQIGELTQPP